MSTKSQLKTELMEYIEYFRDEYDSKLKEEQKYLFADDIGTRLQKSNKKLLRFCSIVFAALCRGDAECTLNKKEGAYYCKFDEKKGSCRHDPSSSRTQHDAHCKVIKSKKTDRKICRLRDIDKEFSDGIVYLRVEFNNPSSPTFLNNVASKFLELKVIIELIPRDDNKRAHYDVEYDYWYDRYKKIREKQFNDSIVYIQRKLDDSPSQIILHDIRSKLQELEDILNIIPRDEKTNYTRLFNDLMDKYADVAFPEQQYSDDEENDDHGE